MSDPQDKPSKQPPEKPSRSGKNPEHSDVPPSGEAGASSVMVTLKLESDEATLEAVTKRLGLAPEEVDPDFGVVAVDPARGLYVILVEATVAASLADAEVVEGVFANPRIQPFDI